MRIALVIRRYDPQGGGAERWTDRHAHALVQRGHEVHVVSQRFEGDPPGERHTVEAPAGADAGRLPFAAGAEALLQRLRPRLDVVHDMGDGWCCDVYMPHHGTRLATFEAVNRVRGPLARWLRPLAMRVLPRYRAFRELERRQYLPAPGKRFVAISEMVRGQMMERYGVPAGDVVVIRNGVDVDRFHPAQGVELEAARARREALGLTGKLVFLLVAHQFKLKGLDLLLRVLGGMSGRRPEPALVVVGDGKVARYRRLAESLGCKGRVVFAGDQADALPWYHAADVYVQPTYYDPCSLTVMEAMACGLPVITTRMNGAAEPVGQGIEGLIMDDADRLEQLRAYMNRYADEGERLAAGRAARRLAQRHTLDQQVEALLRVYRGEPDPALHMQGVEPLPDGELDEAAGG